MFSNSRMFNNSKYGNLLTVILVIAIIAIIGIICFIGYSLYRKYYIEKGAAEAVAQFEDLVGDGNTTSDNRTQGTITGVDNTTTETTTPTNGKLTYKGFNVVGTIQIPSIDLKYPVLEKVTEKSLETSVAWLYGPGLNEVGNNVIIGHNYRNGTMFSDVNKLKNGSTIYITDLSGNKVTYKVYNIYRTSGNDASYMTRDTQGKREISLSTCTNDSKARTLVWAREEG